MCKSRQNIQRAKSTIQKDGININTDLWSIDDEAKSSQLLVTATRHVFNLKKVIRWLGPNTKQRVQQSFKPCLSGWQMSDFRFATIECFCLKPRFRMETYVFAWHNKTIEIRRHVDVPVNSMSRNPPGYALPRLHRTYAYPFLTLA